jgi:DeoR/GlpR family transcriptional regulator of sugar metabolism
MSKRVHVSTGENSVLLSAERHARILDHLRVRHRASVDELAGLLDASTATVRRDLTQLSVTGLLRRVHGGAVTDAVAEVPQPAAADEALAAAVYGRLVAGDAVILEGQSVMPLVARRIAAQPMRLIIATNQLEVARTLLGKPGVDVILLGGKLHPAGYTLPQPLGASDLKFLVANKAFVEVEGVHHAAGITTTAVEDAHFKHELLQHALRKTVVAPASRAGLVFGHRIAQTDEIDCWLTTRLGGAQREVAAALPFEVLESEP